MGIYRERKEKQNSSKKRVKIAGVVISITAAVLFLLLCIPLGKFTHFFWGVFGIAIYPICVLLFLVGIGMFLSQKYTLKKRYFIYLILNFIFLMCLLHAAVGSAALKGVKIADYGQYLKNCYYRSPKLTVGGVLAGILVYPLVSGIGVVGACIVFAILLCLFVGLAIDFMFVKRNKLSKREYEKNRRVVDEVTYDAQYSALTQDYDTRSEKIVPKKFEREDYDRYSSIQTSGKNDYSYYSNRLLGENEQNANNENPEMQTMPENEVASQEEPTSSRMSAHDLLFGKNKPTQEEVSAVVVENQTKPRDDEKYPSKYDPSIFSSKKEYITTPILPDYLNHKVIDREMVLERNRMREEEKKQEQEEQLNSREEVNGFSNSFVSDVSIVPERSTDFLESITQSEEKEEEKPDLVSKPQNERPVVSDASIENEIDNDDDIDDILPKQTFNSVGYAQPVFNETIENQLRRNGREPDLQPRKTPDRSHINENKLSDMVEEEKEEELPKVSAPMPKLFTERQTPTSAPVQASMLQEEKPSFRAEKKQPIDTKYVPPDLRLLTTVSDDPDKVSGDVEARSRVLEETLDSFKISAKVINVVKGPSVTRYELQVPPGIPVKKLSSYEDDIAMTLMSKNGVRLALPIPGKNAAGVEIPNDIPCTVGLKDMIMSREFQSASGALPVAIGKDINGDYVVESLAKMVHLLIAGSTGSGKSVFLHNLILSLMFKSSPEQLRFIMIDPKKVEFNIYNGMPHMMLPNVVTECDKAINSLAWATKEMDRRYRLLQKNFVTDIKSFNTCDAVKNGEEPKLPYIVIVIDELADLMMLAQKEVSKHIQRVAQLGRACGIHLVIATQRPTVQVVTGTIKTNLPTRVAFSLTSVIDSQTILDEGGAEKLIGRGDMLFAKQGQAPERLQSAYASMEEVKAVVNFLKEHNTCYYDEEVEKEIMADPVQEAPADIQGGEQKGDSVDEFFYPALRLFIETGTASTTMIQRRFGVGFARAARLVDQMELKGYVSPQNGSKKRNVYITMEQYRELSGDQS